MDGPRNENNRDYCGGGADISHRFFPFEAVMVSIEPISEGLDQHFSRQSGHGIGSYQC
ncbi:MULTISPECIES: hypothetical protein [unclassified Bradyrhizobium]|jgi:hypothetical protein|uniref:hypothetical protein n=1 Tax=Bradyrhizobium TaxID=374 RepID=UPI0028E5A79B|nr:MULTISPECIES: hypothetical protein [unclassified Bradyrhizobium]